MMSGIKYKDEETGEEITIGTVKTTESERRRIECIKSEDKRMLWKLY